LVGTGSGSVRILEKDIGSAVRVGLCDELLAANSRDPIMLVTPAIWDVWRGCRRTLGVTAGSCAMPCPSPLFCLTTGVSTAVAMLGDCVIEPSRLGGCECEVTGD
jgi:hypothetical protein